MVMISVFVSTLFQPISNADFIVPVEIDNVIHQVYVLKRPYVDEFLIKVGELFECVLFTASLAKVSAHKDNPKSLQICCKIMINRVQFLVRTFLYFFPI